MPATAATPSSVSAASVWLTIICRTMVNSKHVHHRVGGVQGQHLHELNSHHQQQCGGEEIPQGEGLWGEEQGPASLPEQKYRPADDHQQDHGGDEQLQSTGGLQQQDVGGMTIHGASLAPRDGRVKIRIKR